MNRAKLHWSLFIEAKLHWGESEGVQGPPPIFRTWPCLASPGRAWPPLTTGRPLPGAQSLSGRPDWPIPDPPGSLASLASLDNPASQQGWPDEKGSGIRDGSGIWDPGIEILGSDPGLGIGIWDLGSGIQDPGSGKATCGSAA